MRQTSVAMISLAGMVLLLVVAPARADDEPEIAVEAGASEIFVGESVDYVVELRNVKNPPQPDLSALRQDFDIVSAGDESHNQSSMFMFNGKVTQQTSFGHSFRFRLTPKRSGKLVIPAPSATIDGKTISGRALSLNVIAPEAQDVVVPEIKLDRARVYPTQPFEVTLRILVHPLPDDPDRDPLLPLRRRPPHIDANWVDLPGGSPATTKPAGLRNSWPTMAAASRSMTSRRGAARFSRDRARRSSTSTRDARAGTGSTAVRSTTSSTSSNASSLPRRLQRIRSAQRL